MSIYTDNGYNDRKHYLTCISENYGIPIKTVLMLASILEPNKDFYRLINALEDVESRIGEL